MTSRQQISQLVRYHRELLLDEIANLQNQIEDNLEKKQSIRHLKHLIAERHQYLNQFDAGAKVTMNREQPARANLPKQYRE